MKKVDICLKIRKITCRKLAGKIVLAVLMMCYYEKYLQRGWETSHKYKENLKLKNRGQTAKNADKTRHFGKLAFIIWAYFGKFEKCL